MKKNLLTFFLALGLSANAQQSILLPNSSSRTESVWLTTNTFDIGGTTNGTKLTLEGWVKINSLPQGLNTPLGMEAGGDNNVIVLRFTDQKKLEFVLKFNTTEKKATSTTTFELGKWYHIAAVYSSSSFLQGNMRIYVNGRLDTTDANSGDQGFRNYFNGNGVFTIGKSYDNGRMFDGYIDELRVWKNTAVSQADIFSHMANGVAVNASGLEAYWKMNDGPASTTAVDATINAHNAAFTSSGSTFFQSWSTEQPSVQPASGILSSPSNGASINATGATQSVTLTWPAVDFANKYKLYIGTTSGGNDIVNGTEILETATKSTAYGAPVTSTTVTLASDKTYYVRIVGVNQETGLETANPSETSFIINQYLGITDISKTKVSVFPNPFNDLLKISDITDVKSISVTDISGREVKKLSVSSEINLSNLKQGLYIINLNMKDGAVKSIKAIKK